MSRERLTPSGLTFRAILTLVSASALLGVHCPKLPPRDLYRIILPETLDSSATTDSAATPALLGTLGIAQYATPGIYGDPGIVYRLNDTEYNAYATREWALPLGDQLGVLTERVLSRVPLTRERAVYDPPSRRAQTYIWRGTVREFEEVDRGSQVLAAVRIDVRIARAEDDSIVWSGSARLERPAQSNKMPGIVQTLSVLADEVVADLATRARRDLATRTP
jgi:ABC-type uncharacterized transport system auxiliary subunit